MASKSALCAKGPGFQPQVLPRCTPGAPQVPMGGDALPSEIQFLRVDSNLHRSGVEVEWGGIKKKKKSVLKKES